MPQNYAKSQRIFIVRKKKRGKKKSQGTDEQVDSDCKLRNVHQLKRILLSRKLVDFSNILHNQKYSPIYRRICDFWIKIGNLYKISVYILDIDVNDLLK